MAGGKQLKDVEAKAARSNLMAARDRVVARGKANPSWKDVADALNEGVEGDDRVSQESLRRIADGGRPGFKVKGLVERFLGMAQESGVPTRAADKPERYDVVAKEFALARAAGVSEHQLDIARDELGVFKGEPTAAEVQAAIRSVVRGTEERRAIYFADASIPAELDVKPDVKRLAPKKRK